MYGNGCGRNGCDGNGRDDDRRVPVEVNAPSFTEQCGALLDKMELVDWQLLRHRRQDILLVLPLLLYPRYGTDFIRLTVNDNGNFGGGAHEDGYDVTYNISVTVTCMLPLPPPSILRSRGS